MVCQNDPMNRILLIDDDTQLGQPLATYFQRFELQLTHATRPSEGLSLLRHQSFGAVILDVMLPEMDGFDTTRALREREALNPTMGRVPVIALTALAMLGDAERCLAAGMDDYLTKPLQLEQLRAKMQRWRPTEDSTPGPRM